jgi:hypothetical protein
MPRWPAGLHRASQSLPAYGGRSRRIPSTGQRHYWHTVPAELHAATLPVAVNSSGQAAAAVGPAGIGERWDVQLVQVNTTSGPPAIFGAAGNLSPKLPAPPPAPPAQPIAQIWQGAANQTIHLLGQTVSGGGDDVAVTGPVIAAGEQIIIVWHNANPGDRAWALVKGIKYVLAVPEVGG